MDVQLLRNLLFTTGSAVLKTAVQWHNSNINNWTDSKQNWNFFWMGSEHTERRFFQVDPVAWQFTTLYVLSSAAVFDEQSNASHLPATCCSPLDAWVESKIIILNPQKKCSTMQVQVSELYRWGLSQMIPSMARSLGQVCMCRRAVLGGWVDYDLLWGTLWSSYVSRERKMCSSFVTVLSRAAIMICPIRCTLFHNTPAMLRQMIKGHSVLIKRDYLQW